MPFPYPLQYPEVVQKVQDRGDNRARPRGNYRDLSSDGESAPLLRVDVDQRRDQPGYRIEKPDPIAANVSKSSF